jgi:hypothetical protein
LCRAASPAFTKSKKSELGDNKKANEQSLAFLLHKYRDLSEKNERGTVVPLKKMNNHLGIKSFRSAILTIPLNVGKFASVISNQCLIE